ncbi:hypothetical protein OFO07_01090 [Campylobacter sp. JMF_06 NA1]|uniref:hypothetical protein n=1 Tax=Campylobacter sp. JMF_06 NA1 TaxID=2983823 RepID=UPI0022E9EFDF|nr:hypothetical protein [Campylobacter sp. JMF_06 NA1]MDA3077518.1 hypothetical protein [Campylobacter sp. JMF_06 NA1]
MGFWDKVGEIATIVVFVIFSPILVPIALIAVWLEGKENIIALDGKSMSGKDTLINILSGKGFTKKHKATPDNQMLKMEIKYGNTEFAVTEFHNVSGADKANNQKAELRKKIFSDEYSNKNIYFIYLFDAKLYRDNPKEKKDIQADIKAFLKQINSINSKPAREKKINFKVLGTRGDEFTKKDKENIENQIRELGVECEIFDMTKTKTEHLMPFIIGEQK